jgi:hypothetical protein
LVHPWSQLCWSGTYQTYSKNRIQGDRRWTLSRDNRSIPYSIHILLQQHSSSTELPDSLSGNRRRPFHHSAEGVLVGIASELDLEVGHSIVLVGDRIVPEEARTGLEEGRIDLGEGHRRVGVVGGSRRHRRRRSNLEQT